MPVAGGDVRSWDGTGVNSGGGGYRKTIVPAATAAYSEYHSSVHESFADLDPCFSAQLQ